MRNDTLKNLLLSASLISASALLTACGGDGGSGTSATPEEQKIRGLEQKKQEAEAEVLNLQQELAAADQELAAANRSGDLNRIKAAEARKAEIQRKLLEASAAASSLNAQQQEAEADKARKAAEEAEEQRKKEELEAAKAQLTASQAQLDTLYAEFQNIQQPQTEEDIAIQAAFKQQLDGFYKDLKKALGEFEPFPEFSPVSAGSHYQQLTKNAEAASKLLAANTIMVADVRDDTKKTSKYSNIYSKLYDKLRELTKSTYPQNQDSSTPAAVVSPPSETKEVSFSQALRIYAKDIEGFFNDNYYANYREHSDKVRSTTRLKADFEAEKQALEADLANYLNPDERYGLALQEELIKAVTFYGFSGKRKDTLKREPIYAKESINSGEAKATSFKIFNTLLKENKDNEITNLIYEGNRQGVVSRLLEAVHKQPKSRTEPYYQGFWAPHLVTETTDTHYILNDPQRMQIPKDSAEIKEVSISPSVNVRHIKMIKPQKIEIRVDQSRNEVWYVTFLNSVVKEVPKREYVQGNSRGIREPNGDYLIKFDALDKFENFFSWTPEGWVTLFEDEQMTRQTLYGKAIAELLEDYLKKHPAFVPFWDDAIPVPASNSDLYRKSASRPLSATTFADMTSAESFRKARFENGGVDLSRFKLNGASGQSIELGMPLFVQLKGDVSSAKSTEAATGSVAYRLGNTVIGAIQGYANSGAGFEADSRQLETSVVASHSFGSFFVEGQIGSVSANDVYISNWSGYRSQITVGLDTEFVSPFVQVSHRQLDRSGLDLNETTAYVGLDMDIAKLAADTYSIDTRLLAKAGYGSKAWALGSRDLGSTTGFSGSVEWSASLNLNSGVSFSSNLNLDTLAGSSAAVTVSLDR